MSDEIKATHRLIVKDATTGYSSKDEYVNEKHDQTSPGAVSNIQAIGGVQEALDLGDVSTPRWAMFRNLEAAGGAYVEIYSDANADDPFLHLEPQASAGPLPLGCAAPRAVAEDSAGVNLWYKIYEA